MKNFVDSGMELATLMQFRCGSTNYKVEAYSPDRIFVNYKVAN